MAMFASKDEEKREVLLHNVNIEKTLDTSDSASNGVKAGRYISKCLEENSRAWLYTHYTSLSDI